MTRVRACAHAHTNTDTHTHAGLMHVGLRSYVTSVILSSSYFAEIETDELCASAKCHTSAK